MKHSVGVASGLRRSISLSSGTDIYRTTSSDHDPCWKAITIASRSAALALSDLRFIKRLGSGNIGSVYLVELKSAAGALFAAKVIDKKEMARRDKERRTRTEREILEMMNHPFLPTLYAAIDSPNCSCLLMEFCPGGDLHFIRQYHQPSKRFSNSTVRFYASEVVAALQYIHMLGIVYRDLKPENVLIRSDGHIMMTDFDLSLKCDSTPAAVVPLQNPPPDASPNNNDKFRICNNIPTPKLGCTAPAVSCFHQSWKRNGKSRKRKHSLLEMVAEPIDIRSMSFVGTHEYLAPEVVSGEGHGSAVDWWTLGIFIFEMYYGTTPFRGADHEHTLANILARAVEFPKEPVIPAAAKDLITRLLVKDPARRLGSQMGATAVKHHAFFYGVNWALLRRETPPFVPRSINPSDFSNETCSDIPVEYY